MGKIVDQQQRDMHIHTGRRPVELAEAVRADNVQQFVKFMRHNSKNVSRSWLITLVLGSAARNIIAHCFQCTWSEQLFLLSYKALVQRLSNDEDYQRMFTLLPNCAFESPLLDSNFISYDKCLVAALKAGDAAFLADRSTHAYTVAAQPKSCLRWNHFCWIDLVQRHTPLVSQVWMYNNCNTHSSAGNVRFYLHHAIIDQGQMRQALEMGLHSDFLYPLFNTFEFPPRTELPTSLHFYTEIHKQIHIFAAAVATNSLPVIERVLRETIAKTGSMPPRTLLIDYALATRFANPLVAEANQFDLSDKARAETVRFLKSLWCGPESKICRRFVHPEARGYDRFMLLFRRRNASARSLLPHLPDELWLIILHYLQPSPLTTLQEMCTLYNSKMQSLEKRINDLRAQIAALDDGVQTRRSLRHIPGLRRQLVRTQLLVELTETQLKYESGKTIIFD